MTLLHEKKLQSANENFARADLLGESITLAYIRHRLEEIRNEAADLFGRGRMRREEELLESCDRLIGEIQDARANLRQRKPAMFLSVADVAARLSVSENTIYRLVQEGDLQSIRVREAVRIPETSLAEFVRRQGGAA